MAAVALAIVATVAVKMIPRLLDSRREAAPPQTQGSAPVNVPEQPKAPAAKTPAPATEPPQTPTPVAVTEPSPSPANPPRRRRLPHQTRTPS